MGGWDLEIAERNEKRRKIRNDAKSVVGKAFFAFFRSFRLIRMVRGHTQNLKSFWLVFKPVFLQRFDDGAFDFKRVDLTLLAVEHFSGGAEEHCQG